MSEARGQKGANSDRDDMIVPVLFIAPVPVRLADKRLFVIASHITDLDPHALLGGRGTEGARSFPFNAGDVSDAGVLTGHWEDPL